MKTYTTRLSNLKQLIIPFFIALLSLNSAKAQMTAQWVQQAGTSGITLGVSHDQAGNCYATGEITSPGLFDNLTISSGPLNMFIAKYNASGTVQWAKSAGGDLLDQGNEIATDASGNSYVAGYIQTNSLHPTATFDNITLTGHGDYDWFIAKYDASGNVVWAKNGGSTAGDMANGVTIDINGDIYVSGFFSGTMSLDNISLTSSGLFDVFIAKFNSSGTLLWMKKAGGTGSDIAHEIVADDLGNVAVAGEFQNTATFGTNSVTSTGYIDAFIAKYSSDGTNVWVKKGGSSQAFNGDVASSISADAQNNFYITGEFASTATFSGLSITSTGNTSLDIFIAKYNNDGAIQWLHHAGGPDADRGFAIGTDADGNSFVSGFADSGPGVVFDSISLPPIGNEYIFLAKYNPAGDILYVKQYAPGIGEDIDVTGSSCLFMGGGVSISSAPEFDSIDLTFVDRNAFMGKFCEAVAQTCDAPVNVKAKNITASSAKIVWDAAPGAISYLVQFRKSGAANWKTKPAATNLFKLKNLMASTTYEFRVATVCAVDTSTYSTIKTFMTSPFRLEENSITTVEVNAYPNPNAGHFTLDMSGFSGNVSIDIYDLNGKVIYHENGLSASDDLQKNIVLPDSFHGLAMIRVSSTDQVVSKTISVQ